MSIYLKFLFARFAIDILHLSKPLSAFKAVSHNTHRGFRDSVRRLRGRRLINRSAAYATRFPSALKEIKQFLYLHHRLRKFLQKTERTSYNSCGFLVTYAFHSYRGGIEGLRRGGK